MVFPAISPERALEMLYLGTSPRAHTGMTGQTASSPTSSPPRRKMIGARVMRRGEARLDPAGRGGSAGADVVARLETARAVARANDLEGVHARLGIGDDVESSAHGANSTFEHVAVGESESCARPTWEDSGSHRSPCLRPHAPVTIGRPSSERFPQ